MHAANTGNTKRQWTIMVYMAGGSNVSEAARESLLRMKQVGSNAEIDVIAQFDSGREGIETKRYHLKQLKEAAQIQEWLKALNTDHALCTTFTI